MVVVEQASESLAPVHPAILVRWRWRALEQDVVQTLVVPLTMVVGEVLTDGPPQMSFSQRHDPTVGGRAGQGSPGAGRGSPSTSEEPVQTLLPYGVFAPHS